jgi:hypothetical protein
MSDLNARPQGDRRYDVFSEFKSETHSEPPFRCHPDSLGTDSESVSGIHAQLETEAEDDGPEYFPWGDLFPKNLTSGKAIF